MDNNSINLQKKSLLKGQRKSIRRIIIYNMGSIFIDYVSCRCKNVLYNRNKVSPIENPEYEPVIIR